MTVSETTTKSGHPVERGRTSAREFFTFERFGFREVHDNSGRFIGWSKTLVQNIDGKDVEGEIMFRQLEAKHVHKVGNPAQSAFDIIKNTHGIVFNIKKREALLSPTDLAPLDQEGGTILVASRGPLFQETIMGFSVAHGTRGDIQTSKVTAVMEDSRDEKVGLYLKLLQACIAAKYGYKAIRWRMDATKGRNASLFFGLGAKVSEFTLNFYGEDPFQPGTGPSDRLSFIWDLDSPMVHDIIEQTRSKPQGKEKREYPSQSFRDIEHLPTLQARPPLKNQAEYNGLALTDINGKPLLKKAMADQKLETLLYEIPEDAELLTKRQHRKARERLRDVFSKTVRTVYYQEADVEIPNPGDVDSISIDDNKYQISFVSCFDESERRRNFYVLTKQPTPYNALPSKNRIIDAA